MIFLSHNSNDKPVVREIATTLKNTYGEGSVFYDEWSIQPGDGIIDKMNEGLANCKFFFFFISEHSIKSKMVELEWQNALMKKAKEGIKFIPVKIDHSIAPAILLQTLYIDLFANGLEVAKRQIVDVINGQNTFQNSQPQFSNIIGIIKKDGESTTVEFQAQYYMEPQSRFFIVLDNEEADFSFDAIGRTMISHEFHTGTKFEGIPEANGFRVWIDAATSPGFPFTIKLTPKNKQEINILALAHAKTQDSFVTIPVRFE